MNHDSQILEIRIGSENRDGMRTRVYTPPLVNTYMGIAVDGRLLLALVEWLAAIPDVRMPPFEAHSWTSNDSASVRI